MLSRICLRLFTSARCLASVRYAAYPVHLRTLATQLPGHKPLNASDSIKKHPHGGLAIAPQLFDNGSETFEHDFAYSIAIEPFKNEINRPHQSGPSREFKDELIKISKQGGSSLEDPQVRPIILRLISDELPKMDIEEMNELLKCLSTMKRSDRIATPNQRKLRQAFDSQYCRHFDKLLASDKVDHKQIITQILTACELWQNLGVGALKESQFSNRSLKYLTEKLDTLTSDELVYYFYLLASLRSEKVGELNKVRLASIIDKLVAAEASMSLEQLAVCCMGMFKAQMSLINSAPLISAIIKRLIAGKDTVDWPSQQFQLTLNALLKFLHYPAQYVKRMDVKQLLDDVIGPHFSHLERSGFLLTRIAILMETYRIYNRDLLDGIAKSLATHGNNTEIYRTKDIDRALLCLASFGLDESASADDSWLPKLLDTVAVERVEELNKFPVCNINMGIFAAYLNHYPTKLIQRIFGRAYGTNWPNFQSVLAVQNGLRIERPVEFASYLWENHRYTDFARRTERLIHHKNFDKFLAVKKPKYMTSSNDKNHDEEVARADFALHSINTMWQALQQVVREENAKIELPAESPRLGCQLNYVLQFPQYPLALVRRLALHERDLMPLEIPYFPQPATDNGQGHTLALLIHWRSDFADYGTRVRGSKKFMIRLLERLGYKVLPVYYYDLWEDPKIYVNILRNQIRNEFGPK